MKYLNIKIKFHFYLFLKKYKKFQKVVKSQLFFESDEFTLTSEN
jgi:hypothetical protein